MVVQRFFEKEKNMKKIIVLVLAMAMVFSMAAFSFAGEDAGGETKVLRVLLEAEPDSINPSDSQFVSSYVFAPLVTAIYLPLIQSDEEGNIVPGLMTEWEWVDDMHLKIAIRDDLVTYSGTKVTTNDVMYSFRCGAAGNNSSAFVMFDLDNSEIIDDTHMVLAFNQPYPSIMDALQSPFYSVFTQADIEPLEEGNFDISGSCMGRYVFKEWVHGQSITVVRNENYVGDDPGYYDEIIYTFNTDPAARVLALQSGDCDVTCKIPLSEIDALESQGFVSNARATSDALTLYLNCSRAPFDNELVRQAIQKLINREAIIAVNYSGHGTPIAAPFSPATPYYLPYEDGVDVEGAKALLAEAGYANGFSFTLSGLQNTSLAAEVLQANLAEAGINMEIVNMEFGGYIQARRAGDYDALMGLAGAADFANVFKQYDGRNSVADAFGGVQYYNDEYSFELIDAVYAEFELAARQEAMKAACEYFVDKGVMTSICSIDQCDPQVSTIEGMTFNTSVFVNVSTMHPVQ